MKGNRLMERDGGGGGGKRIVCLKIYPRVNSNR
jgi:hypothetical protein